MNTSHSLHISCLGRMHFYNRILLILLFFGIISSCDTLDRIDPPGIVIEMESDSFVFAVIGDYGLEGEDEAKVAEMVKSWDPAFIITTGDNNYPDGEAESLVENITDYYGDYIYNYDAPAEYQVNGAAYIDKINRFFPSPGNHDTYSINGLTPYLNFFTLPGNEEYYSFSWGAVSFFSLNSTASFIGEQEDWLMEQLDLKKGAFNIVYFHHSPYSSGPHGNSRKMQLSYFDMGIDLVLSGHDHIYSRIMKKDEPGLQYMICGAGGKSLYSCDEEALDPEDFESYCNDSDYGALKGIFADGKLSFEYYLVSDTEHWVDSVEIIAR